MYETQNQQTNDTTIETKKKSKENVFLGIIGAFIGSLCGAILWYILYQMGVLAALSGAVGTFAAIYGYIILSKDCTKKGIVIAIIFSLLALVFAWYFCIATDIFNVYKEYYALGQIDQKLTFGEAFKQVPTFMAEPEIAGAYFKDLIIGIIFAIVGSIQPITSFKDVL